MESELVRGNVRHKYREYTDGLDVLTQHQVKALVWFWLIDETLSANLVYQSNHEIGSTTPSDETNKDHDMMMMMA